MWGSLSGMLIRFSVENFKSFHAKQDFSMEADEAVVDLPGNTVVTPAGTLVKTAAVYGHNASGKTNLVAALQTLAGLLERPHPREGFVTRLGRLDPFALGADGEPRPCRFEIELLIAGRVFRYLLAADANRVVEEALEATAAGDDERPGPWEHVFHRQRGDLTFFGNREFGSREKQDLLEETLNEERPLLAYAVEMKTAVAALLQDWFVDALDIHRLRGARPERYGMSGLHRRVARRLEADAEFKHRFLRVFADADLGVVDAEKRELTADDLNPGLLERLQASADRVGDDLEGRVAHHLRVMQRHEIRLTHRAAGERGVTLPWASESAGTRRFVELLAMLLLHDSGPPRTFVVDELEASLSPDLLDRLIRLFHDPEVNRSASQLIFTTHDRSLMDAKRLLRRDQVWVTQKHDDGHSELYSLADFKEGEPTPGLIPSRRFGSGAYGGVAEFGASLHAPLPAGEPQRLPGVQRGEE